MDPNIPPQPLGDVIGSFTWSYVPTPWSCGRSWSTEVRVVWSHGGGFPGCRGLVWSGGQCSVGWLRVRTHGPRKTTRDMQKLHGAMLFLFMGIQCPYTLLITCKPVVHTRLCMAFNFLKQLPKNILLSKSSDISKSSMPKSGHTRHIPA